MLFLVSYAGAAKAQNGYWYNEFIENGAVASDIRTKWPALGDANPNFTNDGTIYVHILTYEEGGNPHGSHIQPLVVSINGIDIWSISRSGINNKYGYDPLFLAPDLIDKEDITFKINSRYYRTLKFKLPSRFWGDINVGFRGEWEVRDKVINFTKKITPDYYKNTRFPYGNNPFVEFGERISPNSIKLTFQKLPNIAYAKNEIILPSGERRETLPNPNFPATISHTFTSSSDAGKATQLSGMSSVISNGNQTPQSGSINSFT